MSSKTRTPATSGEAKLPLVPKLRFPNFRGQREWENAKLGVLSEVVRGGSPRPIDGFLTTTADGLNWLKIGDVDKEAKYVTHTAEKVRPEALSKTRVVNPGDLILSNSMSFGRPYILQIKTCIHDGWIAITDISEKADRDFIYYYISASGSQIYFVDNAAGSGVQNLNADIIKALPVCLPSPAEQQKIAEFLSSLDELIAAQARKVDVLKTRRKALMQQFFPSAEETIPRIRFTEFKNAGNWSKGRIADIATVLQGYGFPERHQGQTSGDYPFYKVSDISRSFAAGKVLIKESANYINEGLLKELRAKPIPEGTTIFAKIGEAIRSNKRAITTVPCLIDNNTAGVKRIKGKATDLFIYLLMEQISLIDHAGGVVPAVNKSAIEEIAIKFPEPEEQECIASCMSSLDALITAESQKIAALKSHKKGLMQQLFPIAEAVET